MMRMFCGAGVGAVIGIIFGVVIGAFLGRPHASPPPFALFVAIVAPIGALTGSIFGAVSVMKEEIAKLYREMQRWNRIEDLIEKRRAEPSTQFRDQSPGRE